MLYCAFASHDMPSLKVRLVGVALEQFLWDAVHDVVRHTNWLLLMDLSLVQGGAENRAIGQSG